MRSIICGALMALTITTAGAEEPDKNSANYMLSKRATVQPHWIRADALVLSKGWLLRCTRFHSTRFFVLMSQRGDSWADGPSRHWLHRDAPATDARIVQIAGRGGAARRVAAQALATPPVGLAR